MTVWLKTLHIASLAIWCGALIAIPSLFARRARVPRDADRFSLQVVSRALFIAIASPAAFVAIASGTALIFLRPVTEPWFALKLLFVGALVALHVWQGLIVLKVFLPDGAYGSWHRALATIATVGLVAAILWAVLDKPVLALDPMMPGDLMRPGRLGEIIQSAYRRWRS